MARCHQSSGTRLQSLAVEWCVLRHAALNAQHRASSIVRRLSIGHVYSTCKRHAAAEDDASAPHQLLQELQVLLGLFLLLLDLSQAPSMQSAWYVESRNGLILDWAQSDVSHWC